MREIMMCNRRAVEVKRRFLRLTTVDGRIENVGIALVRFLTSGKEREIFSSDLYPVREPEDIEHYVAAREYPTVKFEGRIWGWGPLYRPMIRGGGNWLAP